MISVINELPDNVIGFDVSGVVTADDYESVLMPVVDAATADGKKIRLLYHVTSEFEKYEVGAMWDDAKVGLQHLTSWERVAVVTDIDWLRNSVKAFGFVVPGHVRVFSNSEISEAKTWLSE